MTVTLARELVASNASPSDSSTATTTTADDVAENALADSGSETMRAPVLTNWAVGSAADPSEDETLTRSTS